MLIGQVIPLIVVPPQVIVFYLVILSSLGVARNNLLLSALALKQSIVPLLTPPVSSSGSIGYYKIWVFLGLLALLSFATIRVRFKLHIMMYFMNALNTLKLIAILCFIIFCNSSSLSYCFRWWVSRCVHQSTSSGRFRDLVSKLKLAIHITTLSLRGC